MKRSMVHDCIYGVTLIVALLYAMSSSQADDPPVKIRVPFDKVIRGIRFGMAVADAERLLQETARVDGAYKPQGTRQYVPIRSEMSALTFDEGRLCRIWLYERVLQTDPSLFSLRPFATDEMNLPSVPLENFMTMAMFADTLAAWEETLVARGYTKRDEPSSLKDREYHVRYSDGGGRWVLRCICYFLRPQHSTWQRTASQTFHRIELSRKG
jgi:hypothetical protein